MKTGTQQSLGNKYLKKNHYSRLAGRTNHLRR